MENKVYVFEGKTTNEAIEKGLKELKLPKNKVDIKVLEQEDKRSFFSILAPRVVKVEMTVKEGAKETVSSNIMKEIKKDNIERKSIDMTTVQANVENFLKEFISKLPTSNINYTISSESNNLLIDINGEDTGYLIGYRGEVLNSIQNVITNIANKGNKDKIKVMLNIGGYREKREKDLENLAMKIAASVVKTGKSITLEPMTAYERKIIHTKLQSNDKVTTYSVGEEPYRKLVVALNK
ncbi:MAG: protein jag [Clostridia bacterium]|nr:protein jag [Clostridia bacterium]